MANAWTFPQLGAQPEKELERFNWNGRGRHKVGIFTPSEEVKWIGKESDCGNNYGQVSCLGTRRPGDLHSYLISNWPVTLHRLRTKYDGPLRRIPVGNFFFSWGISSFYGEFHHFMESFIFL